jgi:hypothetical protein
MDLAILFTASPGERFFGSHNVVFRRRHSYRGSRAGHDLAQQSKPAPCRCHFKVHARPSVPARVPHPDTPVDPVRRATACDGMARPAAGVSQPSAACPPMLCRALDQRAQPGFQLPPPAVQRRRFRRHPAAVTACQQSPLNPDRQRLPFSRLRFPRGSLFAVGPMVGPGPPATIWRVSSTDTRRRYSNCKQAPASPREPRVGRARCWHDARVLERDTPSTSHTSITSAEQNHRERSFHRRPVHLRNQPLQVASRSWWHLSGPLL